MDWKLIAENKAGSARYCSKEHVVYISFCGNHAPMVLKSILLAVKNYLSNKAVETVITDLSAFNGSFTVLTPWIVQVFNPVLVKRGLQKNVLIESKNSFTNYSISEMVKRMSKGDLNQSDLKSEVINCKKKEKVTAQFQRDAV